MNYLPIACWKCCCLSTSLTCQMFFLYMSLTMSSDIQESFNYHGLTYTLSPDCKEHRWRRGSRHTHPAMSCVEALFLCYRAVFLKFLPSSMLQYSNLPQKSEPWTNKSDHMCKPNECTKHWTPHNSTSLLFHVLFWWFAGGKKKWCLLHGICEATRLAEGRLWHLGGAHYGGTWHGRWL